MDKIPFNQPFISGKELYYISQAVIKGQLAGNGFYTKQCNAFLENLFSCPKVLLTPSCTAALAMAAMLCDLKPDDEVLLPSFTFVSTANAFLLRRAKLVFVDIREDTCNIDESLLEQHLSPRSRVICPVHYAGVGCEMDVITQIARKKNLLIVEDAAQAISSFYNGKPLGTLGNLAALSFHETKNIISGEGGALLINDSSLIERAEIAWEKGTDRSKYFRGLTDKYTWVDIGSSFVPSEIVAAFLFAQLENMDLINNKRLAVWQRYKYGLQQLEQRGCLRLPVIPKNCTHNGHMCYILLNSEKDRNSLMDYLSLQGIMTVFHYIPLHTSPMGQSMGYREGMLPVTENIAGRILRLPMFFDLTEEQQQHILKAFYSFFDK
jgi:dTDP-4-amino-4,6-dideoxygalactose transaminase